MKRTLLWAAIGLTATITLVWPMLPTPASADRLAAIPLSGPDFQSKTLELSAADQAFLGKARTLQRIISLRGGGRLVLTVIDGSGNRHAVHDPLYCLSGAGWKRTSTSSVKVNSGEATQISLAKDGLTADVIWFFDDGEKQFTSPLEYWFKTSCRRATRGRSGPEPLLVSLRGISDEPVNWDRVRQILLPALGFR